MPVSDFAQFGLIATLQRLNDSHLDRIESELVELARVRPIGLVLPCRASDLGEPAMTHIARELRGAKFLAEIVISINGMRAAEASEALKTHFAECAEHLTILQNGAGENRAGRRGGKGGNIEAAFEHLINQSQCAIFATQDADVASFRRTDLARLLYATAHPQLGYDFAKMYYSRVTDRLYGRVSRLFLAPLLQALIQVAGHLPLVDFLRSFRYPLAGEVAIRRELAAQLSPGSGWSVEIGQLCDVFRCVDPRQVCQVEGGPGYDHRHHPASPALVQMVTEVGGELLAQLAIEGVALDASFQAALNAAFRREAQFALRRSASLALINGLPFEFPAEEQICEAFAAALERSWPALPDETAASA